MIAAIHHKKLIPLLIMLFALAGMTLSVIGEALSHGATELTMSVSVDHDDHSHSHNDFDEKSEPHLHHDSGNHSHESVDHLTIRLISDHSISFQQLVPYAGNSPRSFHYQLDRPPKAAQIV